VLLLLLLLQLLLHPLPLRLLLQSLPFLPQLPLVLQPALL
jgi:hypothetical protein